jgi:hypothetical protein
MADFTGDIPNYWAVGFPYYQSDGTISFTATDHMAYPSFDPAVFTAASTGVGNIRKYMVDALYIVPLWASITGGAPVTKLTTPSSAAGAGVVSW